MSDLFIFDLQRFGDVVVVATKGSESVTLDAATLTTAPSSVSDITEGGYYWNSENLTVSSSFEGAVTVNATYKVTSAGEDDDEKEYYVISAVDEIVLPSDGGSGTITTGSAVGSSEAIPINNLGTTTLTVGETTLGFNSVTDTLSGVYVANNKVSYVNINSGTLEITNESGISDLTLADESGEGNPVSVDKPFTYNPTGSGSIIISTEGTNVSKTDDAGQVLTTGDRKSVV